MSEFWDEEDVGAFDPASSPDEIAAWAATAQPWDGIQTPLGELDPTLLSRRGCVDALIALERLKAWADAQQHRLVASLASQPVPPVDREDPLPEVVAELDKQWVREEVACALRVCAPTAAARLRTAVELTQRLPQTLAALHDGRITAAMARRLADDTAALDAATAAAVQRRVLPRAGQQTFSQFAQSLTRAVHALDPRGREEQHQAAVRGRRVGMQPLEHGTGGPQVQVTVALSTLLGCDDQPGELAGYGPIPPPWPARSPPTRPAPGAGWSPTTSAGCSTTDATPTGPLPRSPITCVPATAPARSPPAIAAPSAATSTMPGHGTRADPPPRRTCTPSAPGNTSSHTTPAGEPSGTATHAPNGSAPPASTTSNHPTRCPSTRPCAPDRSTATRRQ